MSLHRFLKLDDTGQGICVREQLYGYDGEVWNAAVYLLLDGRVKAIEAWLGTRLILTPDLVDPVADQSRWPASSR